MLHTFKLVRNFFRKEESIPCWVNQLQPPCKFKAHRFFIIDGNLPGAYCKVHCGYGHFPSDKDKFQEITRNEYLTMKILND